MRKLALQVGNHLLNWQWIMASSFWELPLILNEPLVRHGYVDTLESLFRTVLTLFPCKIGITNAGGTVVPGTTLVFLM